MAFDFQTNFPTTDPDAVPRFSRTFEHLDWIDGESVVQAGSTPTEEGFNSRFRKIIADLEALGADARQAIASGAAIRTGVFSVMAELEAELTRLQSPGSGWIDLTLMNGWTFRSLNTDDDFNRPAVFRDRAGIVHLRGTLGSGPIPTSANGFNSVIARLPTGQGFATGTRTVVGVMTSNGTVCRLDVFDGQLNLRSVYATWITFDGVSYPT